MEREPRQARDAGEILVEGEYAGAMFHRDCGNECIDGCQAHALGARQPENRRCFPVSLDSRDVW